MYKNILGAALRSAPIRADAAAQRFNFKIVGAGEKQSVLPAPLIE